VVEHSSLSPLINYASVLLDRFGQAGPLVMFHVEGGVDIEEVAERHPRSCSAIIVRPARRTLAGRVAADRREGRRRIGCRRGVPTRSSPSMSVVWAETLLWGAPPRYQPSDRDPLA